MLFRSFLRAVLPSAQTVFTDRRGFDYGSDEEIYPTPKLLRMLASEFGWGLFFTAYSLRTTLPRTTIHRHDNAFIFTVYAPDTTVGMSVSTPYGAPVFTECNVMLDGKGGSLCHPSRTWRKECRCFARQHITDNVSGDIFAQLYPEYSYMGCRCYGPFNDAEIRFFPPADCRRDAFEPIVTSVKLANVLDRKSTRLNSSHAR